MRSPCGSIRALRRKIGAQRGKYPSCRAPHPCGVRVFFRFSKNAPLRGAGHRAHQGHRTRQKLALLTFNHDRSTTMPCKSTLNNEKRVAEATQAYNSGKFSSISEAVREFT